jgi:tetratricopeptide (TPR) repeat protein
MRIQHVLLATMLFLSTRDARGDTAADLAKHIDAAKAAFAEERYDDAIAEFRAANALKPDPKIVYSIAQAQRLAGDCKGAIESYQEFLGTKPDAKLKEYSEANIAQCKKELASNPPPVVEPTPTPVVEPTPTPVLEPTPTPVTPDPPPEGSRPWYRDWVGNALVIGGVAGIAVGATFFVSGRNAASKVNDATDHQSFLAAKQAASSALTKQRIGLGAAAVGVGLVVGGVLHYKMSGKREVRVTAVPTDGGAAVVVGGSL